MKSKFFGYSAKLALAILAVGTSLTSCYDSENGDVTKPYVAPDAVYTFVVNVNDAATGKAVVNATVKVGTETLAYVGQGVYQVVVTNDQNASKMATSMALSVSKAGYEDASETITVKDITNGQAQTCYANVLLKSETFQESGLKITVDPSFSGANGDIYGDKELGGNAYDPNFDIINDSNEPLDVKLYIKVNKGSRWLVEPKLATATRTFNVIDEIKKVIDPAGAMETKFKEESKAYTFRMPAKSALQKVSVSYTYVINDYTFEYEGVSYEAQTKTVSNVVFTNTAVATELYHGHGHGHGHGDESNAGGGIFE